MRRCHVKACADKFKRHEPAPAEPKQGKREGKDNNIYGFLDHGFGGGRHSNWCDSEILAPLNLVASSLFGVMTNVQLFEETNDTVVDPTELERAIRAEMHIYGEKSHDEIKQEV